MLLALATCLLIAPGTTQSAEDFLPPAAALTAEERAKRRAVQEPGSIQVQHNESLEVDVVHATTVQDAFAFASRALIESGVGAIYVDMGEGKGTGVLWSGLGSYPPKASNPDLQREAKRRAYQSAYIRAQAQAARHMGTRTIDQLSTLTSRVVTIIDEETSAVNESQIEARRIQETVHEFIKGAVIWEVHDDTSAGSVVVVLASTPRSRGLLRHENVHYIEGPDLSTALDEILKEVRSGVVPPVGGRTIVVPESGELAWVAFGSDTIVLAEGAQLSAGRRQLARKKAEMRASAAMADLLLGTEIRSQTMLLDVSQSARQEFEEVESNSERGYSKLDALRRVLSERSELTEDITAASRGVLPPGITTRYYEDSELGWMYAVMVYSPSLTAETRQILRDIQALDPLKSPGRRGPFDPDKPGPSGRVGGGQ